MGQQERLLPQSALPVLRDQAEALEDVQIRSKAMNSHFNVMGATMFRQVVPKPQRRAVISGLRRGLPFPMAVVWGALEAAIPTLLDMAWDDDGGNAVWAAMRFAESK